jgi:hypothetical protein
MKSCGMGHQSGLALATSSSYSYRGVSPFALTTQVLQERERTPEVVERRQVDLITHLRALWQL